MWGAGHEAATFQQQEHRPHRAGVGPEPIREFLLRERVPPGQGSKKHELVRGNAEPGKSRIGLAVKGQVGGPQRQREAVSGAHGSSGGNTAYTQEFGGKCIPLVMRG